MTARKAKKPMEWPPERVDRLKSLVAKGYGPPVVAAAFGISFQAARVACAHYCPSPPAPPPAAIQSTRRAPKPWSGKEIAHALALFDRGFAWESIGKRLGRTAFAVQQGLRMRNLIRVTAEGWVRVMPEDSRDPDDDHLERLRASGQRFEDDPRALRDCRLGPVIRTGALPHEFSSGGVSSVYSSGEGAGRWG